MSTRHGNNASVVNQIHIATLAWGLKQLKGLEAPQL